jgi:hypothetical protein
MLSPCGRLKKRKGWSLLREAAGKFEGSLAWPCACGRPPRSTWLARICQSQGRGAGKVGLRQFRWGSRAAGVPRAVGLGGVPPLTMVSPSGRSAGPP